MTLYNSAGRIRVTDSSDVGTVFDSANAMPHYIGEGSFSGVVSTGDAGANAQRMGESYYYYNADHTELVPLGISETRPVDFIIGKISVTNVVEQGALWFSFTKLYPLGQWFTLNGSSIMEIGRGRLNDSAIYLIRTWQIVQSDGEFKLRFDTSSKYLSIYNSDVSGAWDLQKDRTQLNVDINVYWGKFT